VDSEQPFDATWSDKGGWLEQLAPLVAFGLAVAIAALL
jgi:hypothetical protein